MRDIDFRTLAPTTTNTRFGPVEYAEFGKGPVVLTLHGAMGGYDQSLLLARTIGDTGFRYIGVSRPGYLGTPLSSGKTSAQQADLCAELLNTLGIESAIIMAVSGGGPCALQFAMRHKQRCRGLVLVSTCGGKMDTKIPFSFNLTKLLVRCPAIANAMQRKAMTNIEQAASRSIPDPVLRTHTLNDPVIGPLFTELLSSTCDRMGQRIHGTENDIAITRSTDYPLESISVPTLIVHGTADQVVPYIQHAKALASRISGAKLVTAEGADHVAIFTHNQELKPQVVQFLHTQSSLAR
ncbi:MAG TPA: alpha/beta hydrolase [Armatimonadota bacterium]|nr:alpha/beta hydrolase [Armatimonadota bacterium]